jgi:hypothetical protein
MLTKDILEAEVREIGNQVLNLLDTSYYARTSNFLKQKYLYHDETLYSGSSGVALYLLELYRYTNEEKYLDAAIVIIEYLIKESASDKIHNYSFYTGRMGVCYMLMRASEITNNLNYVDAVLQISSGVINHEPQINPSLDLLNGTAGTLIGLAHVYNATEDKTILSQLYKYCKYQISNAQLTKDGLYWGRTENIIQGLCGLSHGASGISFALLEVGNMLGNEDCFRIAEEAIKYEDGHYNKILFNWSDLRKGSHSDQELNENINAYLSSNKKHFTEPRYMSGWCHGAPGIGLARLRAYELLAKETYLIDCLHAIENTIQTLDFNRSRPTCTLCHGIGGIVELILEARSIIPKEEQSLMVEKAVSSCIEHKSKYNKYISGHSDRSGKDISLFMGSTGIGMFYLRILDSSNVPSVLLPRVKSTQSEKKWDSSEINMLNTENRVLTLPYNRPYKKTIDMILHSQSKHKEYNSEFTDYLSKTISYNHHHFENFLNSFIIDYPDAIKKTILESFYIEDLQTSIDSKIESFALLSAEAHVIDKNNLELLNDNMLEDNKTGIVLNPRLVLVNTSLIPFRINETYLSINSSHEFNLIVIPGVHETKEILLNYHTQILLNLFKVKLNTNTAIKLFLEHYLDATTDEVVQLKQFALSQIREGLRSRILISGSMEGLIHAFTDSL